MTIASAIAALNPSIWYRLDETSGTNAVNYGTQVNDGTYSGPYVQAVPGPEIGTVATRFGVGAAVRSGVMDLTGSPSMTLACWMQTNATGAINTSFPILSLGIPGNVATRGPRVLENHAAVNVPRYAGIWAGSSGTSPQPAPTTSFWWRWIVCTFQPGTNGTKLYLDGALLTQGNNEAPVALAATDVFQVWGSEPWTIAHACWWGSVLTLTQIQSVAAQLSDYPGGQQIYLPPVSTGGGGLTPAQDTTLTDIDTKTDDIPGLVDAATYISDTVNVINGFVQDTNTRVQDLETQVASLQGAVDGILASIGATLEAKVDEIRTGITKNLVTAEGSILSSAVGGLIAHPDPAYLHETATSFTLSGRGIADAPGPLGFLNVYGIRWRATTIPTQAGLRDGTVREFIHRLVQFALWYPDSLTLDQDVWEVHDSRLEEYTYLWPRYHPWEIRYDVCPGFVLTCHWILWTPIVTP